MADSILSRFPWGQDADEARSRRLATPICEQVGPWLSAREDVRTQVRMATRAILARPAALQLHSDNVDPTFSDDHELYDAMRQALGCVEVLLAMIETSRAFGPEPADAKHPLVDELSIWDHMQARVSKKLHVLQTQLAGSLSPTWRESLTEGARRKIQMELEAMVAAVENNNHEMLLLLYQSSLFKPDGLPEHTDLRGFWALATHCDRLLDHADEYLRFVEVVDIWREVQIYWSGAVVDLIQQGQLDCARVELMVSPEQDNITPWGTWRFPFARPEKIYLPRAEAVSDQQLQEVADLFAPWVVSCAANLDDGEAVLPTLFAQAGSDNDPAHWLVQVLNEMTNLEEPERITQRRNIQRTLFGYDAQDMLDGLDDEPEFWIAQMYSMIPPAQSTREIAARTSWLLKYPQLAGSESVYDKGALLISVDQDAFAAAIEEYGADPQDVRQDILALQLNEHTQVILSAASELLTSSGKLIELANRRALMSVQTLDDLVGKDVQTHCLWLPAHLRRPVVEAPAFNDLVLEIAQKPCAHEPDKLVEYPLDHRGTFRSKSAVKARACTGCGSPRVGVTIHPDVREADRQRTLLAAYLASRPAVSLADFALPIDELLTQQPQLRKALRARPELAVEIHSPTEVSWDHYEGFTL